MRLMRYTFIFCLFCGVIWPAMAGITVTSYNTVAGTNGYAPLSRDQYFAEQDVLNTSPALASVTGDYTGGNTKGSPPTWHWVGSAQTSTTTSFDASHLIIAGNGSFNSSLTTTTEFVDPIRSTTLYSTASGADYQCYFTIESSAIYHAQIILNHDSFLDLSSFTTGVIFDRFNGSAITKTVDLVGVLMPGRYELHANTSLSGPEPLPDGVNVEAENGSFENLSFMLSFPEPSRNCLVLTFLYLLRRRGIYGI